MLEKAFAKAKVHLLLSVSHLVILHTGNSSWPGYVDEIDLYVEVLTAVELSGVFQCRSPCSPGQYRLEDNKECNVCQPCLPGNYCPGKQMEQTNVS
eukprot:m.165706 g.165706  ORF g.165706 m.165706 type:complete len:96 (-) comp15265_c1_seq6:16-303(-)